MVQEGESIKIKVAGTEKWADDMIVKLVMEKKVEQTTIAKKVGQLESFPVIFGTKIESEQIPVLRCRWEKNLPDYMLYTRVLIEGIQGEQIEVCLDQNTVWTGVCHSGQEIFFSRTEAAAEIYEKLHRNLY